MLMAVISGQTNGRQVIRIIRRIINISSLLLPFLFISCSAMMTTYHIESEGSGCALNLIDDEIEFHVAAFSSVVASENEVLPILGKVHLGHIRQTSSQNRGHAFNKNTTRCARNCTRRPRRLARRSRQPSQPPYADPASQRLRVDPSNDGYRSRR